jgi:anti-anti-sigma regulatory factor
MTILLSITVALIALLLVLALVQGEHENATGDAAGVLVLGGLLAAHLRGFRWTAQVMVIGATLLLLSVEPSDPFQRDMFAFSVLSPAILAAVLLPWYWGVGAFVACFTGLAIVWGGQGLLFTPGVSIPLIIQMAGIALASVVSQTARRNAEANARRAEEALAHVERQASELAEANELMSEQLDQQGKLLELVSTLETPVVPLADGILLAPIVGHMDARRADELTKRLLHQASARRAKLVVLDIAGVAVMDTTVAKSLLHTIHALRLLGCEVTLSGISANVAMALIHLGVDLEEVKTVRSPQEALTLNGIWMGKTASVPQHTAYLYGAN